MRKQTNLNSKSSYEIKVMGEVDINWLKAFGAANVISPIIPAADEQNMSFSVVTDQSGLVGLVRQMHGLGIVFLSINRI